LSARHKLNVANVNGALIIAAFAGLVLESWLVFVVVAVVLIACAMHNGDIRRRPRPRRGWMVNT
jgi:hypothetical protein